MPAARESKAADVAFVFHKDALCQILRIMRLLQHTESVILLLGPTGCGKRTLSRLTAALLRYELKTDVCSGGRSAFRECFKALILEMCGGSEARTLFMVTEDELREHRELAGDLSCWASSGIIPGLFSKEELEAVVAAWRVALPHEAPLTAPSRSLLSRLWHKARQEIRVVVTVSTRDTSLKLLRSHSMLLEACALNYVAEWSHSTFVAVSSFVLQHRLRGTIAESAHGGNDSPPLLDKLAVASVEMHLSVARPEAHFYADAIGVLSSRFFAFQNEFALIYESKSKELAFNLEKLRSGITKMEETDKFLRTMHVELEAMKPQLEVKALHALQLEKKLKVRSSP